MQLILQNVTFPRKAKTLTSTKENINVRDEETSLRSLNVVDIIRKYAVVGLSAAKIETSVLFDSKKHSHLYDCYCRQYAGQTQLAFWTIV